MAEIINLRSVRKTKARAMAAAQAAANRAASGRTKEEKLAAKRNADWTDRTLDGARLERD